PGHLCPHNTRTTENMNRMEPTHLRVRREISGKKTRQIFMAAIAIGMGATAFLSTQARADDSAAPSTLATPPNAQVAAPSPALNALVTNAFGPNTIADVAQAVAPSVVNIETDLGRSHHRLTGSPFDFFFNGQSPFGQGVPFDLYFNGQRVT